MDTAQSCCIVMLTYQYVIFNFSRPEAADHIYWYDSERFVSLVRLTPPLTA